MANVTWPEVALMGIVILGICVFFNGWPEWPRRH